MSIQEAMENHMDEIRTGLENSINGLCRSVARRLRIAIDKNDKAEIERIIFLLEKGLRP